MIHFAFPKPHRKDLRRRHVEHNSELENAAHFLLRGINPFPVPARCVVLTARAGRTKVAFSKRTPMNETLLLCLIVAFGGFTQGLTGFGSIIVSLPLLVLFLDIKSVIPLVGLFALGINVLLVLRLRGHLDFRRVLPCLVAALPGIPAGVFLLKAVSAAVLEFWLGLTVLLFGLFALLREPVRRELARPWGWAAGFLSGCLGGSIGANGPPIIVYAAFQPWPKDETRAFMAGFFLLAGIGISGTHAASVLVTGRVLGLFAAGLPALLAGVLAGSFCAGRINEAAYRRLVLQLITALGAVMVLRRLFA